jgi:monoamine oxidase
LNNTLPISDQSWLANLSQLQAGGGQAFFDDTEVFRCTAGNQQLAAWLVNGLPIIPKTVKAVDTSNEVWLQFQDGQKAGPFQYAVVATSVAMWRSIRVDGKAFPFLTIKNGPAIKYLAPVNERFWIPQWLSPSGMSEVLGMTWEGTDNQADTAGFDITVFAGGTTAQNAINNNGTDKYFAPLISQLYPHFATSGGTFVNWPSETAIGTGYSCPAPGEVTGAQQSYQSPYNGCLFVAGEHTSPAWFGYMEGALESGILAAARIARAASVDP